MNLGRANNNIRKLPPRLPIPIAVELHNVFPDKNVAAERKKWYRPDYTTELLHAVRLEISVQQRPFAEAATTSAQTLLEATTVQRRSNSNSSSEIVYTSIDTRRTQCPVWRHLNDTIAYKDLTMALYESLKARFSVVDNVTSIAALDTSDANNRCTSTTNGRRERYFLEISLHPSKLCRIAKLPDNLPLNCTVVRFSDHSIRIHPMHYQLLLDSEQGGNAATVVNGTHSNMSSRRMDDGIHSSPDGPFFDDTVFNALDTPPSSKALLPMSRDDVVRNAMNVFTDLPSSSLLDASSVGGCDNSTNGQPTPAPTFAAYVTPQSDVLITNGETRRWLGSSSFDRVGKEYDDHLEPTPILHGIEPGRDGDDDVWERQLQQQLQLELLEENESLEHIIKQEELALEQENSKLRRETKALRSLMDRIRLWSDQNEEIHSAIRTERAKASKASFILEAYRIRLIRELAIIYPITVKSESRFFIRNLEIPIDLSAGTVADDVVSAALGFLCHLVHLLSKYLGIHLRYRLFCQSSRSAVQDERAAFPLFPGRPAEREQFEYAVYLLDKNIECICRARDIRLVPQLHILAKTLLIYENVIDGY